MLTNSQKTLVNVVWPIVGSGINVKIEATRLKTLADEARPVLQQFDHDTASPEDRKAIRNSLIAMALVPALTALRRGKVEADNPDIDAGGKAAKEMSEAAFTAALAVVEGEGFGKQKPKAGKHQRTAVEENLYGNAKKWWSELTKAMDLPAFDPRGAKRDVKKGPRLVTPEQREKLAEMRANKVKVESRPDLYRYAVQSAAVMLQLAIKYQDIGGPEFRALVEEFWQKVNKLPTK